MNYAPYNFVPHSEKVLLPPEKYVLAASQDVPIKNGICGHIEFELIADGPLLVSEGAQEAGSAMPKEARFFKTPEGLPAIPGSSLRGMLANVLKITTFGKLSQVDDTRLAMRDLTSGAKEVYQRMFVARERHVDGTPVYVACVKAGWLGFEAGRWQLLPCQVARVERLPAADGSLRKDSLYEWVEGDGAHGWSSTAFRTLRDSKFGTQFCREVTNKRTGQAELKHRRKALIEVYTYWQGEKGDHFPLIPICFTPSGNEPQRHNGKWLKYDKARELGSGGTNGTLVVTAHPGASKHMEFIFFGEALPTEAQAIDEIAFRTFRQAYENSDAWKFWMNSHFKRGTIDRIPVFYLGDPSEGAKFRLGFTQLFKLPMTLSIHDAVRNTGAGSHSHLDSRPDFAELIFGRLADKPDETREGWQGKGRAGFSLTTLCNKENEYEWSSKTIVAGPPKPSYYPNYVRQPEGNPGILQVNCAFKTLMDNDAQLRGWKRYQAKQIDGEWLSALVQQAEPAPSKQKSSLHFMQAKTPDIPLRFAGQLHFHNLRPFEVGALLWALTWGGDERRFHSLGMGKPYGFGALRFRVKEVHWRGNGNVRAGYQTERDDKVSCEGSRLNAWRNVFTQTMDNWLQKKFQKKWQDTKQMRNLLALAARQATNLENYRYMKLEIGGENEFVQAKNSDPGHCLPTPRDIPEEG